MNDMDSPQMMIMIVFIKHIFLCGGRDTYISGSSEIQREPSDMKVSPKWKWKNPFGKKNLNISCCKWHTLSSELLSVLAMLSPDAEGSEVLVGAWLLEAFHVGSSFFFFFFFASTSTAVFFT